MTFTPSNPSPGIFTLLFFFGLSFPVILSGQTRGYVIDYSTLIMVNGNSLTEEKTYLIQVDNKLSDWLSDIKIYYNKAEKLEIIEAVIINSAGAVVRKLGKKEIVTRSDISSGSLFEDDYVKEFNLRWHEFPYRIKYSYRKTSGRFIYIANWSPVVFSDIPTLKASLKIQVPTGYQYKTYSSGNLKFSSDSLSDPKQLSWVAENISPPKTEIFAPYYRDVLPSVYIVPESFTYGIPGTLDSWETLGKWQGEINRNLFGLTASEKTKADSLINGINDKTEIARRLYHFMQDNTRYVNVSIDIGGLQPFPASYVCNNKYGDCKALAIYMMALLKYAGIESYYTKVNAGSNPGTVIKEFPAPQFNHIILCLPIENDTLWLENTNNLMPFGYLGTFTQNRDVLVVNGEKSKLVKTPPLLKDDVTVSSSFAFKPSRSGKSVLKIKREVNGPEFERVADLLTDLKDDRRRAYIRNLMILNGEVVSCSFKRPDRDKPSVLIDSEIEIENLLSRINTSLVFNFVPTRLFSLEKPTERKYPLKINYPVNQIDTVIADFSMLKDYDIIIPPDSYINTKYGMFSVNYLREKEKITVLWKFRLNSNNYSLDDYTGFYDFIESIKLATKKTAIILSGKL
jgi:transglutaminase-like putative cysteine protease